MHYLTSTGIAFLIAVSINYYFSRRLVFNQTTREFVKGYYWFLVIAGIGVLLVVFLMYLLVGILGWQYLMARVITASIVGMWNYLLNLFFNFQVAGRH